MSCEVLTWVVCGRDDVIPSIESRSRGPAYTRGVGAVGQLCRVLCVPESEWTCVCMYMSLQPVSGSALYSSLQHTHDRSTRTETMILTSLYSVELSRTLLTVWNCYNYAPLLFLSKPQILVTAGCLNLRIRKGGCCRTPLAISHILEGPHLTTQTRNACLTVLPIKKLLMMTEYKNYCLDI